MLHTISVASVRSGAAGVYVGRGHATVPSGQQSSALGNPFVLGQHGTRAECIERFRRWLWAEMQDSASPASGELRRLVTLAEDGPLTLLCWCAPKPCHAEVIAGAVRWLHADAASHAAGATRG